MINFKHFILTVVAVCSGLFITACNNGRNTKPAIATISLKNDSGYVTKREILSFLLANNLTDTIKEYWQKRFKNDEDTIGKYFPSNTQGNKILLVKLLYKQDTFEHLVVLEINNSGQLLKNTAYWPNDEWCDQDAVRSFIKTGRYFMITGCGHGSGYGSEYMYIFDRVIPEDNLAKIYISIYKSYGVKQIVNSTMKIYDSSILIHYTIIDGYYSEIDDKIERNEAKEGDVLYTWVNNNWKASDSSILKEMDMD